MITTLVSDFSRVLLFPKDLSYSGSLNQLYDQKKAELGEKFLFFDYFELNHLLLEYFKSLKSKVSMVIFTSEYIQNDPALAPFLDPVFDQLISAKDHNVSKNQTEAYAKLAQLLVKNPHEIIFMDDSVANTTAARQVGYKTIKFESTNQAKQKISEMVQV